MNILPTHSVWWFVTQVNSECVCLLKIYFEICHAQIGRNAVMVKVLSAPLSKKHTHTVAQFDVVETNIPVTMQRSTTCALCTHTHTHTHLVCMRMFECVTFPVSPGKPQLSNVQSVVFINMIWLQNTDDTRQQLRQRCDDDPRRLLDYRRCGNVPVCVC